MQLRIVAGLLGELMLAIALFMVLPCLYALVRGEGVYTAFLLSIAVTGAVGWGLYFWGETKGHIGLREGFLVVSGSWILASACGSLPYWLSECVPSYLDAVFETVSGLTTTGASIISDVETLPGSVLLWRSLTHWLGGMGIIVLFLVFLKHLGADAINLFRAESPGPTVDRVMPRIRHMALTLWKMYVLFTGIQIALLYLAGMNMFDAVNHSLATLATGGFSTKNNSIKYYDSVTIELIIVFFMFVGGGNFSLYYMAWTKGFQRFFRDSEFILYTAIVVTSTVVIAVSLYFQSGIEIWTGLRDSLFAVVSLMTTTGFVTADFDQWPPMTKVILMTLMLLGGCGGSTSGGLKVIRLLILFKDAGGALLRAVHPKIVRAVKIDTKPVDFTVLNTVLQFFFLYMLVYFISVILVTATGLPPFDTMGAVAATLGNVGPGFGTVGPTTTFADVHPFAKFIFIVDMLLVRLELFTLLVLLHPEFWQPYFTKRAVRIR